MKKGDSKSEFDFSKFDFGLPTEEKSIEILTEEKPKRVPPKQIAGKSVKKHYDLPAINFSSFSDKIRDLEMDKVLRIVKFVIGGIVVIQILRVLYTLYYITDTFLDIKAGADQVNGYNQISMYGWTLGIQIFWMAIWLGLFFLVQHFSKPKITIDDILKHAND